MTDLRKVVISKINALGVKKAAKFFGVSVGTVSNWSTGKTSPSLDAVELALADSPCSVSSKKDEITMWEGRKVAMLLPVYKSFNPDTHFTLFANYAQYGPEKIAMPKPIKQTCIWEARNMLIDKAMGISSATDFIMSDDDMIHPYGHADHFNSYFNCNLPPEIAGVRAFSRILSHPNEAGVVGATYYGRHDKGKAQCAYGFQRGGANDERLRRFELSGLIPQDWVGTGFIRIKRWVIEALKKEIDKGRWPECKPLEADQWYGYFNPIRVGVGEDVSFGRRCAEIGIVSYLDASLVCLHNGECNFGPNNTKPKY